MISMTEREILAKSIELQNSILVLERRRREVREEFGELQHLMRDLRHGDLKIDSSVYCRGGPTFVKKKAN